jgi:hypothetical protein
MLELIEDQAKQSAEVLFFEGTLVASHITEVVRAAGYDELLLVATVGAVSGTIPTLVPAIEISGNNAEFVHRHTLIDPLTEGNLTRLTVPTVEGKILGTGRYLALVEGNLAEYVRINCTLGGTSPSFRVTLRGYFKRWGR